MFWIKEGKTNIKYLLIVLAAAVIVGGSILIYTKNSVKEMISLFQFSSPKKSETSNWKSYKNEKSGFQFKYPENFGANVWRPQFWPPQAAVVPIGQDPLKNGCPTILPDAQENKIKINNIDYSLFKSEDAGAGSLYTSYCYIAEKGQKNYLLYFVIWSHLGCGNGGCGAYCGTEHETECMNLDRASAVEKPIEKIVSTFKF